MIVQVLLPFLLFGCLTALPIEQDIVLPQVNIIDILNGIGKRGEQDLFSNWQLNYVDENGQPHHVNLSLGKREEQDNILDWAGSIISTIGHFTDNVHITIPWKRGEEDITFSIDIGKREEQDNILDWASSILSTISHFTDNVHISIPWKREEEDITISVELGKRAEQDWFDGWTITLGYCGYCNLLK